MSRSISVDEARRLGLLKGSRRGSKARRGPKKRVVEGINGTRVNGMLVGPPSKGPVGEAKRVEVIP